MRKNLVLLRVGPSTIHREWIDADRERSWDLYLSPYTPMPDQSDVDCTVGEVVPGPKWAGIREVLNTWDGWRQYDHIWLPDDDIRTTQDVVDDMFRVAEAVGLDLFAPALDADSYYAHFDMVRNTSFYGRWVGFVEIMVPGFSRSALERLLPTLDLSETGWGLGLDLFAPALDAESYYAHFDMMQNTSFYGRWVGFVEIMVPGFSRRALERLLPTLDLSETGWGLGLDSVWPKLLDYSNIGMLDGITVTHTRPIGERRDDALAKRMLDESDAILAQYDCGQVHTTFNVFGEDLQPLDLPSERLLVELVKGWLPLIENDPRILPWIVDHQRQHASWAPYPVEGTPEVHPVER